MQTIDGTAIDVSRTPDADSVQLGQILATARDLTRMLAPAGGRRNRLIEQEIVVKAGHALIWLVERLEETAAHGVPAHMADPRRKRLHDLLRLYPQESEPTRSARMVVLRKLHAAYAEQRDLLLSGSHAYSPTRQAALRAAMEAEMRALEIEDADEEIGA